MSFLELINFNGLEILTALIVANFSAQIFKTLVYALQEKKLNLYLLFSTGGMPSSHSAAVTAMAVSTGLVEGFNSTLFAISFCVAVIVMYDAAGVRRAAGRQARVLNTIIEDLLSEEHKLSTERLKEFLGHTPKEVLAGGAFGAIVSVLLRYFIEHSA